MLRGSVVCLMLIVPAVVHASSVMPSAILEQVPGNRLAEVEEVLTAPTFVRTLKLTAAADSRVFTYLLDHPDLNAALARSLGIAVYRVARTGPGRYQGVDDSGNMGSVEVFGTQRAERAVLERGTSPGWWFGDLEGRVVALVTLTSAGNQVRGEVTVWARIDRGVVDRLLRVLGPMLGGFLDRKLREQFGIPFRVAEDAARHPDQFCALLAALSVGSRDERQTLGGMAGCNRRIGRDETFTSPNIKGGIVEWALSWKPEDPS
jgi:hypothetical protein